MDDPSLCPLHGVPVPRRFQTYADRARSGQLFSEIETKHAFVRRSGFILLLLLVVPDICMAAIIIWPPETHQFFVATSTLHYLGISMSLLTVLAFCTFVPSQSSQNVSQAWTIITYVLVGILVIFSWIGLTFLDLDLHAKEEIESEGRSHILHTCYESALLGLNFIVAFVLVVSFFALQEFLPLDDTNGVTVVTVITLLLDAGMITAYCVTAKSRPEVFTVFLPCIVGAALVPALLAFLTREAFDGRQDVTPSQYLRAGLAAYCFVFLTYSISHDLVMMPLMVNDSLFIPLSGTENETKPESFYVPENV